MNTRQLITAAALLAVATSVSAQARDGIDQDPFYPISAASNEPGKSRAQVRAELEQAYHSGMLTRGEEPEYPAYPVFMSKRTREEVRAEAVQALKNRSYEFGQDVNG